MDSLNPYASPGSDGTAVQDPPAPRGRRSIRLGVAWTAVFLLNLPIPLLFGWDITALHGALGMFVALIVSGVCGGWICVLQPKFGLPLVVGGAVVALSQLFPLLQIIAGVIALGIGRMSGQIQPVPDSPGVHIASEAGGFLVTMMTGLLLLVAAFALGWPAQFLLPARWRSEPAEGFTSRTSRPDR